VAVVVVSAVPVVLVVSDDLSPAALDFPVVWAVLEEDLQASTFLVPWVDW